MEGEDRRDMRRRKQRERQAEALKADRRSRILTKGPDFSGLAQMCYGRAGEREVAAAGRLGKQSAICGLVAIAMMYWAPLALLVVALTCAIIYTGYNRVLGMCVAKAGAPQYAGVWKSQSKPGVHGTITATRIGSKLLGQVVHDKQSHAFTMKCPAGGTVTETHRLGNVTTYLTTAPNNCFSGQYLYVGGCDVGAFELVHILT